MAKSRTKTLSYRRSMWVEGHDKALTIEHYLREANKKLKKVGQRKFPRGDGQVIQGGKSKSLRAGGLLLHLVAGTPGDQASTLPANPDDVLEFDVDTAPAPEERDYMDGDILALVRGDDVFLCSTVLRDGSFTTYCRQLFLKAKLGDASQRFELQNVASIDKMKLIKAQGVKTIELRASLYEASTKYLNRKEDASGAMGAAYKHFQALFGKKQIVDVDNVMVSLEIGADLRIKNGRVAGTKLLTDIAKDIIDEDDDNYVIVTKKNQRISQKEVFVRKQVSIDRHGKSVSRDKAWEALADYAQELMAAGVTKQ